MGIKKGMFIVFVSICLFFMATLAVGADWQYLGLDKNGTSLFFDRENITDSDGIIKIYQKEAYSEDMLLRIGERFGERYLDMKEIVNLIEIDCSGKRSRTISVMYYDSKGKIIESRIKEGMAWTPISQKSELNILYELCCPAEWVYVTSSKDDDYFLNIGKMTVNNSNVTFWMKGINRKTSQETEKDRFTIQCKNGTYALRYHVKYSSDGPDTRVKSYDRYLEWSRISTNTIIGFFQNLLCSEGQARKDIREQLNYISQK